MNNHGGKREGSGAPTKIEVAQNRTIRLSTSDWKKFKSLGGVKWLREIIHSQK